MKVVVLNDGETYSDISGCRVIDIPDDVEDADLELTVKEKYLDGEGQDIEELLFSKDSPV